MREREREFGCVRKWGDLEGVRGQKLVRICCMKTNLFSIKSQKKTLNKEMEESNQNWKDLPYSLCSPG